MRVIDTHLGKTEKYRDILKKKLIHNSFFKKYFIYFFRERGREGEREGEKHRCVVASHAPPTQDLTGNPGMCPAWESNQQSLGSHGQHPIH